MVEIRFMGLFSSTVNCRAHVRSTKRILWHILCANRMIGNIECLIQIFFLVCTLSASLTSCWTHMRQKAPLHSGLLQTFRRKWGRKGGWLYFLLQPNMISSVKSVGTLTLMKTILSFLQYSASHETSAQVIWMEGWDKKTDRSFSSTCTWLTTGKERVRTSLT